MLFYKYKESKNKSVKPTLLWEYDLSNFDYEKMCRIVVERVIERGDFDDWYAILNLYGLKRVKEIIKTIGYMNKRDMNFVSIIFNIPLNEMKCYNRPSWRVQHWDS